MSSNVPAKLKTADITRFAQRAAQLEKIKPPVAYWCYYWIVNQILAKGLHTADEECNVYTTNLLDKLEEFKVEYPEDAAIHQDAAGQAYVEQFGQDTFQRADNAIRLNKASRQTAETFQAAGTFLDLVQIWSPPTPGIASKIKYAKYHALRIAKAIKAGEDPNLSNPQPEPTLEDVELDPNDPEVQKITGNGGEGLQPTVEDVPNGHDRLQRSAAAQSNMNDSIHPSRASSLPRPPTERPSVSPLPSAGMTGLPPPGEITPFHTSTNPRHNSVGGGYFPEVDRDVHLKDQLPTRSISIPPDYSKPAPSASTSISTPNSHDFYTLPSPSPAPAPPNARQQGPPPVSVPVVSLPQQAPQAFSSYLTDDEAILAAQKHSKWAISALTYEDVPTAVKELRLALKALGMQ